MKDGGIYLWDGDSTDDLTSRQLPEACGVAALDLGRRLQDTDGYNEVRRHDEIVGPVDTKTMRRELLIKNGENSRYILWELVDDVVILIGLNQATR